MNRLSLIKILGQGKFNKTQGLYKCICGTEKVCTVSLVKNNKLRSCGCLRKEVTGNSRRTHGKSNINTYRTWAGIIQRCFNPKNKWYRIYGGRGITVCPTWLKFESFLLDMGERPSKNHSIDRIDSNKGYNKENCRWATSKEQANNTSRNVKIEFNGITKTLQGWADSLKLNKSSLKERIDRWGLIKALTTPKLENGKRLLNEKNSSST